VRQLAAKKKTPKEVQHAIAKMRARRVGAPPAPHITQIRRAMSGATYQHSNKECNRFLANAQLSARSVLGRGQCDSSLLLRRPPVIK